MLLDAENHPEWGVTLLRPRDTVLGDGSGLDSEQIRSRCAELARSGEARFLLDLSSIEYVDSRGLSVLVLCLMSFSRAGSRLAAFGANPLVDRLIRLTRLDTVLPLYSSLEDALAAEPEDSKPSSS